MTEGGQYSREGTKFTSEKCPAGHYSPVNFVQGDIIHGGTVFTATPVINIKKKFFLFFGIFR